MELKRKVVLITGAGRGLGRQMALAFAAQGCQLALADIEKEGLVNTLEGVTAAGADASIYQVDVANEQSVETLFDAIETHQGPTQILINNAGILRDGFLVKRKEGQTQKLALSKWQSVIDVNLTGVFLCGREFAARLPNALEGCIINLSSLAKAGNAGQSNYSAAKAGVAALTVCWAQELARYHIRVAAIAPGFIETDMTAAIRPDIIEQLKQQIPLKQLGQPEHIAQTALFIAQNDYVSGRIFEIDGGARL
jgi:3-oxoacyl-[acyl-carrier protein] reductase